MISAMPPPDMRGLTVGRTERNGAPAPEGIELDAGAIEIMKKLGLLPALHLGTFRVAYQELRFATEKRDPVAT